MLRLCCELKLALLTKERQWEMNNNLKWDFLKDCVFNKKQPRFYRLKNEKTRLLLCCFMLI
jgi:hypothetical protein